MLEDHHRAVAAVIRGLPPWKRSLGRPSCTWLRAVEADLGQQNIGLASICLKDGSYSRRLAAHCGHSNAPAEYTKNEKKKS